MRILQPIRRAALILIAALSLLGAAEGGFDPLSIAPEGTHPATVRLAFMDLPEADQMRFLRWLPRSGRRELYSLAVESLHSPQGGTLEAAINCLARIKVPLLMDNLDIVRERIHHHNPRIRWLAVRLVGEIRDDLAIEDLIARLGDETKIAQAARQSLVSIANYDAGSSPERWQAWYTEWLDAEERIIPGLAAKLESEDEDEVLRAMHMLILLKSHRHTVGDLLNKMVDHPSPQVRALVLSGMRNLGGVAALKSPEAAGRSIIEVLREIDDDEEPSLVTQPSQGEESSTSQSFGASQVITILVLISLFGGAALYVRHWAKQNPQRVRRLTQTIRRKRKPTDDQGAGDQPTGDEAERKKPRITFTR